MRPPLFIAPLVGLLLLGCETARSGKRADAQGGDAGGGSDGAADATDGAADATDGSADATDGSADGADGGDGVCLDKAYTETLPSQTANLNAEIAAFDAKNPREFVLAVLAKRYPVGKHLVEGGLEDTSIDCVEAFLRDADTATGVIEGIGTVVHECGHVFDSNEGGFSGATYVIDEQLRFECTGLAYTGPNKGFARSLINGDDYAALRPSCGGGFGDGCDFYADTYLDGDPTNKQFEGGDQGFDSLLEETVQYVNSLATGYAFVDYAGGFSSTERDGILTFQWYVERYLRMARLGHPEVYEYIVGDRCWRDAILTVWGRANFYLEAAQGEQALGIDDAAIRKLVEDPELLGEIQRIRDASGCQ